MSNWNARDNRGVSDRDGPPQRFPNSGSVWPQNTRENPKSPEMKGSLTISDEVLDYLIREAQNGNDVTVDVALWGKITRDNRNFWSMSVDIPYKVKMEEQGNPTYRQPRPNYPRRQEARAPVRQQGGYAEQSGRARPRQDEGFDDELPDFLRDEPPF